MLERYRIPAVVFVCSDPIARGRLLWYDAAARLHGEATVQRLKTVPFAEWQTAVESFDTAPAVDDAYAPLTVDELRRLADTPGIEIGGHTRRHGSCRRRAQTIRRDRSRTTNVRSRSGPAARRASSRTRTDVRASTTRLRRAISSNAAVTLRRSPPRAPTRERHTIDTSSRGF